MVQSNDLARIPGYVPSDHDQLLKAINKFIIDEEQSGN
jgi:hypothetical protein